MSNCRIGDGLTSLDDISYRVAGRPRSNGWWMTDGAQSCLGSQGAYNQLQQFTRTGY
jgi:hypothetical protein